MVGIMSAMQEEIQALLNHTENTKTYTKGKRNYYTGTLFDKEVVLVFSRWGKVASATTATQLINDFNLNELIFTGVAGSVNSDVNIGDIVIGKNLVQHDMDTFPLYETFEIPLLQKTFFETHPFKREQLSKASQEFINNYKQLISEKEAIKLNIHNPSIFIGDIASGDQFVSKPDQVNFITSNLNSVLCVEMEGAAVAQVCYEYDVPFSIFRIISDKANDNALVDFPRFVSKIASNYSLQVFKNYFLL
ncbi:5'-methylthioadenosine/adenosylhomocysteine nucleosidase [Tenacibaculum sp. IB213877]|uniref:5'-methylthioadenosine/adenosylhomocysteine nucleosidase n=1 Tax=Tenacibaculum sp. IB213877 TaxID=3097351 RepID=UPI002A5AB53F|nr:5'-methylthioadenosine/adenosylhomocysteine nucleosidase [Tenacibaculum sp. IB213877]MDY0779860.1 5'-methylthioadenosine/adenosylhomocysteine nucleosidase [Tenacibaculum sp. IB213877]